MERVIVTVKRKNEARVRDLEVPTDVEAGRLAELIAHALRWESDQAGQPMRYQIEAQPLGRLLQPNENLAGTGVWDGSWLVLHPVGGAMPDRGPISPTSGPVTGWRQLGIDLPLGRGQEPAPGEEQPSGGFVWKRLDE